MDAAVGSLKQLFGLSIYHSDEIGLLDRELFFSHVKNERPEPPFHSFNAETALESSITGR